MSFAKKLKKAMEDLKITQSQLSGMTGIGKSSISQYLSNKSTPSETRQREIAAALGLEENYFEIEIEPVIKLAKSRTGKVQRLLPEDAASLMSMKPETVRKGLQQGVFPWGYAIKTRINPETGKVNWCYFINARRFAEIEGVDL